MNKLLIICMYLIVLISVPLFETIVKNKIRRTKNKPYYIYNGNIQISYLKNKGAMLGTFANKRKTLLIITSIMLFIVIASTTYVLLFVEKRYLLKIGLMILSSGALSNSLERYIYKYVVDYFSFPKTLIKPLRSIVFNMADMFIFSGLLIIMLSILLGSKYL